MSLNLLVMWTNMGSLARGVAVLLLLMSVVSLTVGIERLLAFRRTRRLSRDFAGRAAQLLGQDRVVDTLAAARACSGSHLARVVSAAIAEFQKKRRFVQLPPEEALEAAQRAAERATLVATTEFKRGTGSLATIGATAPFVGLFGTVVGIINAFAEMAKTGHGGIDSVAAGISEALVTTALGLLVALPAVWLYNDLMQRVERFQVEMVNSASELIDHLVEHGPERPAVGLEGS